MHHSCKKVCTKKKKQQLEKTSKKIENSKRIGICENSTKKQDEKSGLVVSWSQKNVKNMYTIFIWPHGTGLALYIGSYILN